MSRRNLLIASLTVVLLTVLGAYYALWAATGPKPGPHTILVETGSGVAKIASQLERAGAIPGNATTLRVMDKLFGSGEPIQAGEFLIPAGAGGGEVLELLREGRPVQRLVTIPEGTPSVLVHERLMREPLLSGVVDVPAEGSVLPDSYSFERGETRAAVLGRMQAAMERELAKAWAERKPTTVVKSPQEAVTLASVVEKETGLPSERRMVAGVYSNRLRVGMKLDADPTVIYPVTKGRPLGRRILRSELNTDNGYNTYLKPGLPAGPIANPGLASINAVLDPEPTQALYFVARGDGGHVFANTLAEHNANVQKWYALRRQRGEM